MVINQAITTQYILLCCTEQQQILSTSCGLQLAFVWCLSYAVHHSSQLWQLCQAGFGFSLLCPYMDILAMLLGSYQSTQHDHTRRRAFTFERVILYVKIFDGPEIKWVRFSGLFHSHVVNDPNVSSLWLCLYESALYIHHSQNQDYEDK